MTRRLAAPAALALLVALAATPAPAGADVLVGLTVHATPDGPATLSVDGCSFHVKGAGILDAPATVRILDPSPSEGPVDVASAAFAGQADSDGLVDGHAGPFSLDAPYAGLVPLLDYGDPDIPDVAGAPFDVLCPPPALASCSVVGFLPPMGTPGHDAGGGVHRFRAGQTIPVKLHVDCPGAYETPTVHVAPAPGGVVGAEVDGATRSQAYEGNEMRRNGNHWHYVLDTRGMGAGLHRLRVDVGDGAEHTAWVLLT